MKIQMLKAGDLRPYENNPRLNDNAVEAVKASIQAFGFKIPIVTDENLVILAGHTRLKAAQELGMDNVPVLVAEGLTEAQKTAYRIADNRAGEMTLFDFEKLTEEIKGIGDGIDMGAFTFEPPKEPKLDMGAVDSEQRVVRCPRCGKVVETNGKGEMEAEDGDDAE